jgi:hypothetical protein
MPLSGSPQFFVLAGGIDFLVDREHEPSKQMDDGIGADRVRRRALP